MNAEKTGNRFIWYGETLVNSTKRLPVFFALSAASAFQERS
jgi:hypothetical protein